MPELMLCRHAVDGAMCGGDVVDGYCERCGHATTGESELERTRLSQRVPTRQSGAVHGVVPIEPIEPDVPLRRILPNPSVPASGRVCRCGRAVGRRGRDGSPAADRGTCACGRPFSFLPRLRAGDLVCGQYYVEGCIAYGGMGFIYLGRDRNLDGRWVVLKGVLNEDDPDAVGAAIAERKFLTELSHPNIVRILNFVEHNGAGYIVMEYLPGRSLRDLRSWVGGRQTMPVERAIAYVLQVLPALEYLHDLGLAYCDFKPENVISSEFAVVLIDLGAVYRDGISSVQFGTHGFQAPEAANAPPSVESDLYTVGRTLAKLTIDLNFGAEPAGALPSPDSEPIFAEFDSFYRFLLKATATEPQRRFRSASEMAAQLELIQYEVVARHRDDLPPPRSRLFTGERFAAVSGVDESALPALRYAEDASDGADRSTAAGLRAADALIEAGNLDEAADVCRALSDAAPMDWRVPWTLGRLALRCGDWARARLLFDKVYSQVPGELAPRLALGFACEQQGDLDSAERLYNDVSTTSHDMISAAFGLARCAERKGDRDRALEAYDRVPRGTTVRAIAQAERVRLLIDGGAGTEASMTDVLVAGAIVDTIETTPTQRAELTRLVLAEALRRLSKSPALSDPARMVAGHALTEKDLRRGLEMSYRTLARYAESRRARFALVDEANRIRPWSVR